MKNVQPISTERMFYLCGSLACVNLKYVKSVYMIEHNDKWAIVAAFSKKDRVILEEDVSEVTIRNMFYNYNKHISLMTSAQYLIKEEK